ncbi:MBL fold metallo-hydrolase [Rhodococcus sp. SGAir0479]|uniref:MBL fold metallo-hydrolase n=1 Tax=Rhodococcus sp. SGAir0479 TaxID=2567884 RepID=UPI0010CD12FD|nr:MBL fold metallo-hydrolase [Rhodococcus sp. SGAir0479]QCQ93232.1 MBL fold metallo-hydrolase [Rhodococcus sp. SGAir0479]
MTRPSAAPQTAPAHWTDTGAHEVASGVFRIPLPLPEGPPAINVYAVADGPDVVLIDSGWATDESVRLLERSLERIGYSADRISQFLITHWHTDHYSLAATVRRRHGTPISLGAGERETVERHFGTAEDADSPFGASALLHRAGASELIRDAQAALQGVSAVGVELPDRWLEGTRRIELRSRTLVAVPTPGHTNGHYSFWDPEAALLFAGDHVLPRITPWIGLEAGASRFPLADYLSSLLLVQTMPEAQLLPAHGPTTPSAAARARELIEHHRTRLELTLDAVAAQRVTALEVAHRLHWTRHRRRLADLPGPLQSLAVIETAAHLDVLVQRGAVDVTDIDGVAHYLR